MFNFKQLNSYLKRLQALGDGLTPARPPALCTGRLKAACPLCDKNGRDQPLHRL